jgi:uncharacterized protein (TIGR02996 family)
MPGPVLSAEGLALVRAARSVPADDTARLVLADWLDEHDHSSAADRLRFWVGVRAQVRLTLAKAESALQGGFGPPSDWRNWAETRESWIQEDWISQLCAVEVEHLVLLEPDLPAIIVRGTDDICAGISERADPGRPSPPLCAELEWVAVGCAPPPEPDPYQRRENRFPFECPDHRRGIELVSELARFIDSGSETVKIATAAAQCLWRTAGIVFHEAQQAERAAARKNRRGK